MRGSIKQPVNMQFGMQPACHCLFFTSGITKTTITGGLFRALGYPLQKPMKKTFVSYVLSHSVPLCFLSSHFFP